ncbi:hypothetical protein FDUTEX481_07219 [Tolypothrix sp. PCC 7601]|nr:hypothetical protein FDUTEX481_07219 [Tolypothrix sp. PCC 7601]
MYFIYPKKAVLIKFKLIQVNKKLKQYPVQFLVRFNKSLRQKRRLVNFTAEMVHRYQGMISLDYDSIHHVDELLRQIRIKESQLKIAQESNMVYTAQALEKQILKLQQNLSESRDPEIHALMSLLDD